ncbi:MAG: hypothetical protein U0R72_11165 [Nakamurella multipartita]
MTRSLARRRRIDRIVAGAIALIVLAVVAVVYLTGCAGHHRRHLGA